MAEGKKTGKRAGRILCLLCFAVFLTVGWKYEVYGSESGEFQDYDLSEAEQLLERYLGSGRTGITFSGLLSALMRGDFSEAAGLLAEGVREGLTGGLRESMGMLGQIMVLGTAGAVFAGIAGVLQTGQVSVTGFFVTYLLIFTLLAAGFSQGAALAKEALEQVSEVMRALMPSYFLAAAFAGGAVTAAGLYEGMLLMITGVQGLFLKVLLPGTEICFLLMLAGHMVREDLFVRLREVLQTAVSWGIRTAVGLVVGIQLLQGMVLPYADAVKNSGLTKALEAIPGIGQGMGIAAKMVMGSGVLIKNTLGVGAVLLLALLTLVPVVKLGILALFYQLAAAALEPVCDKRITSCVAEAAGGYRLLLKLVASAFSLFVIAVALVCTATNVTYYAG